jgi:hypothetical protein
MPKYNGYELPALPETEYPIAFISVYPAGFACLSFADKPAYVVDIDGDGNRTYTLLQTSQDPYDESKMIFGKEYVVATVDPIPDVVSIAYPGISTTEWMELEWELGDFDIPYGSYYGMSCGTGPHWSNTTLYDVSGNVVIEGTEPVNWWFDLKSWLTGFALGLAGKPLSMGTVEREPVVVAENTPISVTESVGNGYMMYNHIKLPASPEVDSAEYPYSAIMRVGKYVGRLSSSQPGRYGTYNKKVGYFVGSGAKKLYYRYDADTLDFVDSTELIDSAFVHWEMDVSQIIWANFDIRGFNGNGLYFTKSPDPIPLDGMTVIEWNGDAEGLETNSNGMYLISKVAPTGSGDCVLVKDDVLYPDISISLVNSSATEKHYEFTQADGTIVAEYDDGLWVTHGATLIAYTAKQTGVSNHTYNLIGWLTGRRIAGQRKKTEKVPVAYLYNGVRLPKLPEWDKEKYPYAIIALVGTSGFGGSIYSLRMPEDNSVVTYGDANTQAINANKSSLFSNVMGVTDENASSKSWADVKQYSMGDIDNYIDLDTIIWTNFDIYKTDGTLYLAASDPIPVYE